MYRARRTMFLPAISIASCRASCCTRPPRSRPRARTPSHSASAGASASRVALRDIRMYRKMAAQACSTSGVYSPGCAAAAHRAARTRAGSPVPSADPRARGRASSASVKHGATSDDTAQTGSRVSRAERADRRALRRAAAAAPLAASRRLPHWSDAGSAMPTLFERHRAAARRRSRHARGTKCGRA